MWQIFSPLDCFIISYFNGHLHLLHLHLITRQCAPQAQELYHHVWLVLFPEHETLAMQAQWTDASVVSHQEQRNQFATSSFLPWRCTHVWCDDTLNSLISESKTLKRREISVEEGDKYDGILTCQLKRMKYICVYFVSIG